MKPINRVRNSRDNWKKKNNHKRKELNRFKRKTTLLEKKIDSLKESNQLLESGTVIHLETEKNLVIYKEQVTQDETSIEHLKEKIKRQQEEIQRLEDENLKKQREIEKLKEDLEAKQSLTLINLDEARWIRTLFVYLILSCGLSFRSIPKILQSLMKFEVLKIKWIPHFTSGINWAMRVGLAKLTHIKKIDIPWIAIIDTLIGIGIPKGLVILRVPIHALQRRGSAVTLQDCEVICCEILMTCTSFEVETCLEKTFDRVGKPIAIIKDGGSDLKKGVEIFREDYSYKNLIWVLDDLGHIIANALKHEFSKLISFKRLLTLVYHGSRRLRQTVGVIFMPPVLRTKGRFQSICKLASWALRIIELMSQSGSAQEHSIISILRKAFPKLPRLRPLIERLWKTCEIMNTFQALMKNHGLNQFTYHEGIKILSELPDNSWTKQVVLAWLEKHLGIQCRLGIGQTPLLVSTDIIESLFGIFKSVLKRSPLEELNRLILIMPAFCGDLTPESIEISLNQVTHKKLKESLIEKIPTTIGQLKRQHLVQLNPTSKVPKMSPFLKAA